MKIVDAFGEVSMDQMWKTLSKKNTFIARLKNEIGQLMDLYQVMFGKLLCKKLDDVVG